MLPAYETIAVTRPEPHILQVTLNRPEFSNAFNTQMSRELMQLFEAFQLDLQDVRVIVLGLDDVVVIASAEGVFVAPKDRAAEIKSLL